MCNEPQLETCRTEETLFVPETVEDGDGVDGDAEAGVAEGDEGRVESAGERLEGLVRRAAEIDDGVGRDEVRRVGALVRVEGGVVHDLLLRKRVGLAGGEGNELLFIKFMTIFVILLLS